MTDSIEPVNPEKSLSSKVVSIKHEPVRKTRQKSENDIPEVKEKPKKLSPGDLYNSIFNAIEGDPLSLLPKPKFSIKAFELQPGIHQPILDVENGEALIVGIPKIRQLILDYCHTSLAGAPGYSFTAKQAQGVAEFWYDRTPLIEKPKRILFPNVEGRCLRRIPFDLLPNPNGEHTPHFNGMFKRVKSNAQQMKAFIWSILLEESHGQQFLYIHGKGNDGKGALTRTLFKLVGKIGIVQNTAPWKGNKHWAIPFENKRLAIFPDFQELSSLDNGILKSLTGGDPIYIDPKGSAGYTTEITCKLIFCSNEMPNLGGWQKSDLRRIIMVEMESTEDFDPHYESYLEAELPYFLTDCKLAYEELCPNHERIKTDDESKQILEDANDDKNSDLQVFFENHLKTDIHSSLKPLQITLRLHETGNRDPFFNKRLRAWLASKGFPDKRASKTSPRLIHGLALKSFPNFSC